MHYVPHVDYAFLSVEHIMRDVNNGWFFRYVHANGASMMFIVLYASTSNIMGYWCCYFFNNSFSCIFRLCFTLG